jgi:hypothetical protein
MSLVSSSFFFFFLLSLTHSMTKIAFLDAHCHHRMLVADGRLEAARLVRKHKCEPEAEYEYRRCAHDYVSICGLSTMTTLVNIKPQICSLQSASLKTFTTSTDSSRLRRHSLALRLPQCRCPAVAPHCPPARQHSTWPSFPNLRDPTPGRPMEPPPHMHSTNPTPDQLLCRDLTLYVYSTMGLAPRRYKQIFL